MATFLKPKVVSIATVDTCKSAQLADLYTHLLETNDKVVIEPSNRKLMINCVKTCNKFKKYQHLSKIPEVLFCFDGQSNFLCSFVELSNLYFDISLPKNVLLRYSVRELNFDDKKKILYQIYVGEMFHEVAEIPWWALTLPQMITFTQEKVEGISAEKVKTLAYPHTWLASKLKTGHEFKKQFGHPSQFDYTTFGFSLSNPLDCSWSCVKTNDIKLINSKIKSMFAKSSVPPLSQNMPKPVSRKINPPLKATTAGTKPEPKVLTPLTEKLLAKGSTDTSPAKEKAQKSNQPSEQAKAENVVAVDTSTDKMLIQVTSAEFLTTMNHEQLNSVIECLNLDLPKATEKNIKTLAKSYFQSADHQQRLLLTPFHSLIFCFNDSSKFTCMYHELNETIHNIVIQKNQLETYSLDRNKDANFSFIDLKRLIFHSLLSKEKYTIELPWVGLTRSQKLSISKLHSQDKSSKKSVTPSELLKLDDSSLLQTLKASPFFSHSTKKKLENSLMFEFSIGDPLQPKGWEITKSAKSQSFICSLKDLFGIKTSVVTNKACSLEQESISAGLSQPIVTKKHTTAVSSTQGEEIASTSKNHMTGEVVIGTELNVISSKNTGKDSSQHSPGKGGLEPLVSFRPSPITSTPIPHKKIDQDALKKTSPLEEQTCKICSKQYGKNSTLECFVCKNKVHFVCYKGANGKALSQECFEISKDGLPNHKWFCNKCNDMPIESLARSIIDIQTDKSSQIRKENSLKEVSKIGYTTPSKNMHDSYEPVMLTSEIQNAAYETLDHVSAINHNESGLCFSSTEKESQNLSGDIGPMSVITEVEEEKQEEYTHKNQIDWNSEILNKIDLLLNQRKKDSKMMSEIHTAMRPSHRKTNDSYSGKLDYPNYYHGPTYNIPEKAVKTNVKPAQTVVVSKDISCSLSKGSSEIKKEFNKLYEGVSIENCFASKGGSIFIELTNEDVAKKVVDNWKTYYFTDRDKGPKEGTVCKLLSSVQNSVIVKAVPTDLAEEFIEKSIEELYPGARVKRFVKTGNVKLRTVKIDFIIPGQSDEMIKNGLLLNNLLFRAEKYIPRQRVIQCYHCYKFGHVAKFCHQKKPTCPFCAQAHYHEECDHTRQLCCNCLSPNHYATNRNCPKFQAVLEKIKNPRETNNQNSKHESQNLNKNLDNDF
ncbi:hypothetical protein ACHWQZ_G003091 [Mnemiopsis leidyi]